MEPGNVPWPQHHDRSVAVGLLKTSCAVRFLLLLLLTLPAVVQAQFNYITNNGTIKITGYSGPGGVVVIPETINGLPVTSIGNSAFFNVASLTNVTIPGSVVIIEDFAFGACAGLTSVTIPRSVASIGYSTFLDCTSLTAITVDADNSAYGSLDGVLFGKNQTVLVQCPGGKTGNYSIPSSVTSIATHAFSGCASLTSVTISTSVTSIESAAFRFCTGLTTVTIPNSVTNIGGGAFYGCTRLTAITVDEDNSTYGSMDGVLVDKSRTKLIQFPPGKTGNHTIPSSVTNIESFAFYGCTLTGITIPGSVTSIENYAFAYCSSLSTVTISSGLKNIRDGAFAYCNILTHVTIPDTVDAIEQFAFADCTNLMSLLIPNSVTFIEEAAFLGCNGLMAIIVGTDNSAYRSVDGVLFDKNQTRLIQCPGAKIGNYTIPNGVRIIENHAFANCTGLASVIIPGSVTFIGGEAFAGCTNLSGVYAQGAAPEVPSNDDFWYSVFDRANPTVYYLAESVGWGSTFGGRPTALWQLQFLPGDTSFGVRTNQFGFNINWASGRVVVVEACTDLAQPIWSPVGTNTLTDGSSYFSDPQWTNHPARFYRLRAP